MMVDDGKNVVENVIPAKIKTPNSPIMDIKKIPEIINYITDEKNSSASRIKVIESLKDKFNKYRILIGYFSQINNKSIYIYLIDLFMSNKTDNSLKNAIIDFFPVLITNIEVQKNIFEYIYQKISLLYRGIEELTSSKLNDYLKLLIALYGNTDSVMNPKNYFCSLGNGAINSSIGSKKKIYAMNHFMVNINFRIDPVQSKEFANLITINFSNAKIFKLDLKYPLSLYIKNKSPINKKLPTDDWISLCLAAQVLKKRLNITIYINGEIFIKNLEIADCILEQSTFMTNLSFFEGFVGEFTSIMLICNRNNEYEGILKNTVLQEFKNYQQGIWKKSICEKLISFLNEFNTIIDTQAVPKRSIYRKRVEEYYLKLSDDIAFILTPFTVTKDSPIIEDALGNYGALYTESVRCNQYKCSQKKAQYSGSIGNLIPIAEMLYLHQNILNVEIFNNYLTIISKILNGRKHNIQETNSISFFEIVSLFIEKYPSQLFEESTLESLSQIGKVIFSTDLESSASIYFEHIFMNEKIIKKFSQELQIKYWEEIDKFCQSDKTQIETFVNMQKICLILRSYDEEKYTKMCCEKHYDQFKKEYAGNKNIMNPTMKKKLSDLKGIMFLIIDSQTEENAATLFKLLTLDVSPCLAKFIVSVFINAFQKSEVTWCQKMIKQLFNDKSEIIIANTFRHSLLDVRLEIMELLFEMHKKCSNKSDFDSVENMIKTCLIPENMFYEQDKTLNANMKEIKDLATHCASKIKRNINNQSCLKFKGEIIVFKDEEYDNYIQSMLKILLLWCVGEDIQNDISKINFSNKTIKYIPILKVLIYFIDQLQDIKVTQQFFGYFEKLFKNEANSYSILKNKVVLSWIISICFENFQSKEPSHSSIYSAGKNIIVSSFINSTKNYSNYFDENKNNYPFNELNTIFQWGDKVRTNYNEFSVLGFMHSIFSDILTGLNQILNNFELTSKKTFEINFIQKNYLIFISYIFQFYFYYKLELPIQVNGIEVFNPFKPAITIPEIYIMGMRVGVLESNDLEKIWKDFNFVEDIMNKFGIMWEKENRYKKHTFKKGMHKILKYDDILKNIILNKDKKNLYLEELKFLCFENIFVKNPNSNANSMEFIEPLIKIIPITLANMIIAIRNLVDNETQYCDWLKKFKNFIFYIMLGTTNLILKNQEDLYLSIQEKCIDVIVFGICFLKDELSNVRELNAKSTKSKKLECLENKLKSTLRSIITFALMIVDQQYSYHEEHKSIFKSLKVSRNDLSKCAIFKIFSEFVLDKNQQPLCTPEKLKKYSISQYISIVDTICGEEWKSPLFENKILKKRLDEKYFGLPKYQKIIYQRFENLDLLNNEIDDNYKNIIFNYVESYETELEKYSGGSFIRLKQRKKKYKNLKKILFSWNGYWSDKELFYEHPENLKLKILHHYTKSFMRPILVPILDIDYYLPNFSGFKTSELFRDKKSEFKLNLDIDSMFKGKNQSVIETDDKILNTSNNYLRTIYKKSNSELSYAYLKLSNKTDINKDEELSSLVRKNTLTANDSKKEKEKVYLCCLVKQSHHIKGVLFVTKKQLVFKVFLNQKTGSSLSGVEIGFSQKDEDFDHERNTCFGSYFVWHHKDLDMVSLNIDYDNINLFFRRRYYYKDTAFEIFTRNNKSYYFNFKFSKHREKVIESIVPLMKEPAKLIDDLKDPKDNFDNVIGYLNQNCNKNKKRSKKIKLSKQIEEWTEWKISNFEMIMIFNLYSNRSYSDISQYPVFPWILCKYKDPLKSTNSQGIDYEYRDLSLPMGMLEVNEAGMARKENFIEIYESLKNENDNPEIKPYVYGSHYSNPFYVTNFLTRLFPFTHIAIELQGQKFDNPDRLFLSVENSFYNSCTQKTDLRELVPEFFYLPEMFRNINNLNMGVKENNELVDNVLTPCNDNPYEFVMTMKEVLEGDYSSYSINKWIDLIFGFKQRGKEAELAYNIFTEASYIDLVDLSKSDNKACLFRLVDFGLTPIQSIGSKECPGKIKKDVLLKQQKELTDDNNSIIHFKCKNVSEARKELSFIVKLQYFEGDKLAVLYSNNDIQLLKVSFSKLDKKFYSEISCSFEAKKSKIGYKIGDFYDHSLFNTHHVKFYNKGKTALLGGFYDGKIQLISFGSGGNNYLTEIVPLIPGAVTAIEVDKDEEVLFSGNVDGYVTVYQIDPTDINFWIPWKVINDSKDQILCINSNLDLNIWGSSSKDGMINLYTFPDCKLFRSFKLIDNKIAYYILFSSSPLPSVCLISNGGTSKKDWEIITYSINGNLISRTKEQDRVTSPFIMRDLAFKEYLCYISKNKIIMRTLPLLYFHISIDFNDKINHISVSDDMRMIYGINIDGTEVSIFKDRKLIEDANEFFQGNLI